MCCAIPTESAAGRRRSARPAPPDAAPASGFTAFIDIASENGARLIRLIQDCGKRIPEDVSLITFENAAVSGFLSPALTTLGYDYPAMARNAIGLMLQELRNGSGLHSVKLPTALTVRASTGPASG